MGLHLGAVALHSLFLYSDTPPPHPFSIRLAEASFESNLYLYKYRRNLVPVILLVHMTYEDGTDCSETWAHKIQMPGNCPKERIQHSHNGVSLKSRIILGVYSPYWTKVQEFVAFRMQMHINLTYIVHCVLVLCW
jgi:hypothetical protein